MLKKDCLSAEQSGQVCARYGIGDLYGQAQALHAKAAALAETIIPATVVRAYVFELPEGPQGPGACAVIFALTGMGDDLARDVCEGLRVRFDAGELPAACAALAQMSAEYQDYVANELRQRIRAASALPPQERSAFPDFEPDCPLE